MQKILLPLFILLFYQFAVAQITVPGTPASFKLKKRSEIPVYKLPDFKHDDTNNESEHKPYVFAKAHEVDINCKQNGKWTELADGSKLWQLLIASPGALNLNFTFGNFELPKGSELYLYSADRSHVIGAITSINNKENKMLSTVPVRGDSVIVEYIEPADAAFHANFFIERIGHGFRPFYQNDKRLKGTAEPCQIDIACADNPEAVKMKQAVCKIIYNNGIHCTGTLVNNTNNDRTPYVLTAGHCVNNETTAKTAVFIFNYENSACQANDATADLSISGASVVATDPQGRIDFSLLRLSEVPPAHFVVMYSGWNFGDRMLDSSFIVHHPRGDVKKYSSFNGTVFTGDYGMTFKYNSHWQVSRWDEGATEGGSSGSALFNKSGQLFGTLTGGEASCKNPVNDYFQKLSEEWEPYTDPARQLKYWLDPLGSGVDSLDLLLPYKMEGNPVSYFSETDVAGMYTFGDKAAGTWTSKNAIGFEAVASRFVNSVNRTIYAVGFPFKHSGHDFSGNKLTVWKGVVSPQSVVYQSSLKEENVVDGYYFEQLPDPVLTSGTFFVGVEFSEEAYDTLMLYAKGCEFYENSSFVAKDGSWYGNTATGFAFHLASEVYVTNNTDTLPEKIKPGTKRFKYYSNEPSVVQTKQLFEDYLYANYDTTYSYEEPLISEDNGYWLGTNVYGTDEATEVFYFDQKQVINGVWLDVAAVSGGFVNVRVEGLDELKLDTAINCLKLKPEHRNFIRLRNKIECKGEVRFVVSFEKAESPFAMAMYYSEEEMGTLSVAGQVHSFSDYLLPQSMGVGFRSCYSPLFYAKDSVLYEPITKDGYQNTEMYLNVYPVPVDDVFTLEINNCPDKDVRVEFINDKGQELLIGSWDAVDGTKFQLSSEFLPNGIYFIKVISAGEVASAKLLVCRRSGIK